MIFNVMRKNEIHPTFIIWLQVANLIIAGVIFFAVPRQATLELSGRFCPDQDIFFKKSS
jgi:hypothetical protein